MQQFDVRPILDQGVKEESRLEQILLLLLGALTVESLLTSTVKKESDNLKEKVEEEEWEEVGVEDDQIPPIAYSFFEEQFIAGQLYNAPALDYIKMFYGEEKRGNTFVQGEEYSTKHAADTERELLSAAEAKELFSEIQYATVMGAASNVSFIDRRKFNYWIMFNKALFALFEYESVTREVNYAAY